MCSNWQHCSLTQGFYGTQTGKFCDIDGVQLVTNLLSTPLVMGLPGRSYTFDIGNATCVADLLPMGRPAKALANGDAGCGFGPQPVKNILFGQGVALALNSRLDNMLPGVLLTTGNWLVADNWDDECGSAPSALKFDEMIGVSQSVFDYLEANYSNPPTVNDLLALVNDGLGGALQGVNGAPSLSSVGSAAGAINEAFDECVWVADMGGEAGQLDRPGVTGGSDEKFRIDLSAYPNPFMESSTIQVKFSEDVDATIDVYNLMGIKVSTLGSGHFTKDRSYNLVFTPETGMSQATYFVVVITEKGTKQFRIIKIK